MDAAESAEEESKNPISELISIDGSPLKRWVFITGNRWVVSGVALLLAGVGFVVIGSLWTEEILALVTEEQVVQSIMLALMSGIILLVSVVVSVNSIVLSQEITALGAQENEIEESYAFRKSVQENTNTDVSPTYPSAFLEVLLETIVESVESLHDSVSEDEPELLSKVEILRDDTVEQIAGIEDRLTAGRFGTSDVLFAGIQYEYSRQIYAVRQLKVDYEETLSDEQVNHLDRLITALKHFTIGREYFKTLYFKRELANLSRGLLLSSFPAIVFLTYALLSLRAGLIPEVSILGLPSVILFVGVSYIIGLIPYTLFSVYILRTATISIKTLSAGPFILQEQVHYDWVGKDDD